jgi:hypothetical protein
MATEIVLRDSDGTTVNLQKQSAEQCNIELGAQKVIQVSDFLTQRIAYNSNGLAEYLGYANPGSIEGSAVWMIKKLVYDGNNVTQILFCDGDSNFDNTWTNYDQISHSYS